MDSFKETDYFPEGYSCLSKEGEFLRLIVKGRVQEEENTLPMKDIREKVPSERPRRVKRKIAVVRTQRTGSSVAMMAVGVGVAIVEIRVVDGKSCREKSS